MKWWFNVLYVHKNLLSLSKDQSPHLSKCRYSSVRGVRGWWWGTLHASSCSSSVRKSGSPMIIFYNVDCFRETHNTHWLWTTVGLSQAFICVRQTSSPGLEVKGQGVENWGGFRGGSRPLCLCQSLAGSWYCDSAPPVSPLACVPVGQTG